MVENGLSACNPGIEADVPGYGLATVHGVYVRLTNFAGAS
jgi:hypothetical protein